MQPKDKEIPSADGRSRRNQPGRKVWRFFADYSGSAVRKNYILYGRRTIRLSALLEILYAVPQIGLYRDSDCSMIKTIKMRIKSIYNR